MISSDDNGSDEQKKPAKERNHAFYVHYWAITESHCYGIFLLFLKNLFIANRGGRICIRASRPLFLSIDI